MDERGTKSTWKILIAVAIVCGVVVFAAGFLHRRAVVDAVAKQEARSAAVAKAMTSDVAGVNLTKEAKGADEKALEKSIDPPAGTDVAIFSLDGERVYATAGARTVSGDRAAIADAAKGNVSRVVDGNDLVVYAPIPSDKKGQLAVAAVVSDHQKVLDDGAGPLDAARLPLTALGIVLFVVGLVMLVRERKSGAAQTATGSKPAKPTKEPKAAKPSKGVPAAKSRVSGFDPVPAHSSPEVAETAPSAPATDPHAGSEAPTPEEEEPAAKRFSLGRKPKAATAEEPVASPTEEAPKKRALFGRKAAATAAAASVAASAAPDDAALEREVAIRQLLENQLEQLRTRLQTQEEQASASIRDLRAQLEAAQAGAPGPTVGPAEQDMIERLRTMEAELAQARQAATEATAQTAAMQQELAVASASGVSADAAEMESQLRALQQQLEEAQRTATESEQRAQSIESVRGELEVRVAQLGSKAGELEQKAEQLEERLREANEGGDAVRAEIATLTAALASAEARVAELEGAGSSKSEADEEIARLRGELGKQMERAQVAEERVATLEADVLAAEHGVEELSDASAETVAPHDESSSDEPAAEGSAPVAQEVPVEPATVRSEAAPDVEVRAENPPAPSGVDRYDDVWSAAFPVPQNGSQEEASVSEAIPEPDAAPTPESESTVDASTAEPEPVAESVQPEPEAGSEHQPAASQDEASEPEDNMSVDDDLWALRARLAHAGETEQERQTPPAPSWS